MAYQNVKITELNKISAANADDLFLLSRPTNTTYPYESNAISAGGLSSTIKTALENDSLNVKGEWTFDGESANLPKVDTNFNPHDFIDSLEDPSKLSSYESVADGSWYKNLSSTVVEKNDKNSPSSLSVSNDSIPNIALVERSVAMAYSSLLQHLTNVVNGTFIPSRIGQIVISTKLSTASGHGLNEVPLENNIRRYYGYGQVVNGIQYPDTEWIQHAGYFLKGAAEGVKDNSPSSDGGENNITLSLNNLPKHTHTATFAGTEATLKYTAGKNVSTTPEEGKCTGCGGVGRKVVGSVKGGDGGTQTISYTPAGTITVAYSGMDNPTPFDNCPPFKNVYIWERIA